MQTVKNRESNSEIECEALEVFLSSMILYILGNSKNRWGLRPVGKQTYCRSGRNHHRSGQYVL